MWREVRAIMSKDFRMEWRQRHAIGGVFLYVIAAVFVAYSGFGKIAEAPAWNALFWIILLFAAFNAASRSFSGESPGKKLYLYSLARAEAVVIGKMLYNAFLMLLLTALSFAVYAGIMGSDVLAEAHMPSLLLALALGAAGLAFVLTLVAALAAQTDNNLGLTAILGLPVILPLLLVLIRFTKNAIEGIPLSVNGTYAWQLGGVMAVSLALSYILFPYLWRE